MVASKIPCSRFCHLLNITPLAEANLGMRYVNQAVGAMSVGAMSLKQMAPQKELESADSNAKKK